MIKLADEAAVSKLRLRHKVRLSEDPAAPLVFLIHGRAGNLDVMWTFKRCIPDTASIISLEAPLADKIGGFSWWDVSSNDADLRKIEIETAVNLVREFVASSLNFYSLNPVKLLVLGFSQGAILLSSLIQIEPTLFDGVGLLAGFALKDITGGKAGVDPEKSSKIFIANGVSDEVIPVSRAREGAKHLKHLGFDVTTVEDPVGHKVGSAGMRALKEWVTQILSKNSF